MFIAGALWTAGDWLHADRMPLGDFAGYAAEVQAVRDALLEHGRVPRWCVACQGGSARFTSSLKEVAVFPLAVASDPIAATQLAWLLCRVLGAFGLYLAVARWLGAPAVGIAAGYAYAFGALPNSQGAHLDMAAAGALLPFLWWGLLAHFRRGDWRPTLGLAAGTALLFAVNWVYAFALPFAALAVLALRPWPGGALGRRWLARSAAALAAFAVLGASHVAWLVADAPHHALVEEETAGQQRSVYVERSPFLFFNRSGWLDGWLAHHQPPGFDLARWDGDRRYLGAVVMAVAALGWLAAPRGSPLRRGAGAAALLLWLQYWLALGPRTLLWEVAASFSWSEALEAGARTGLRACAVAAAIAAGALRLRERPGSARLLLGAALLFFPTFPLWSALGVALPPLAVQRSPGHFFDTAHLWLSLAFACSLAALAGRIHEPRRRHALVAAVGAALALDFAPSRHPFAAGWPMEPLRRAAALVARVEGADGTLRIAPPPGYRPDASWVIAQSEAGHARSWLRWQAGRHWDEALERAAYGTPQRLPSGALLLGTDDDALAAMRVRYFLLPRGAWLLPPPWRRLGRAGDFALWELPEVAPMARGVRQRDAPGAEFAVASERSAPERIALAFDAGAAPGWVVVSESHHPWWRARSGGASLAIEPTALGLMAVPVGPGPQRIALRFERPAAVAAADALAAVAWLALAPVLLALGWGRRRDDEGALGWGRRRGDEGALGWARRRDEL